MLQLDAPGRAKLWHALLAAIEEYTRVVDDLPVWREVDGAEVRAFVEQVDFEKPLEPVAALRLAGEGLTRYQMHFSSPRHFGLFDPDPSTMSIAADALVAAINPQLAAWIGSPFGVETERRLVRQFGERFGYLPAETDGTFTSGGAEANHTALVTALVHSFPDRGWARFTSAGMGVGKAKFIFMEGGAGCGRAKVNPNTCQPANRGCWPGD